MLRVAKGSMTPRSSCRISAALALALAASCASAPPPVRSLPAPAVSPLSAQWIQRGESFEGRPIEVATFGGGKRRVYIVGGIHGDERTGPETIGNLRRLLSTIEVERASTVRLLRDMNPDGTARDTRGNARGVDLNRNFPASNFRVFRTHGSKPLSEPESATTLSDLNSFEPDLVLVFHCARGGPFVNFDGPAEEAARTFAKAAAARDDRWHVRPSMGYPTPGSIGSLLGVDRNLPVLTIEFPRGMSGEDAWPALSAGLRSLLE